MRIKRPLTPLQKKARRGMRGYPLATIAWYGPDDQFASKLTAAVILVEGGEAGPLERWFSDEIDVRRDRVIGEQVLAFIRKHAVKSVVTVDRIIGCPHEEGVDYPEGEVCPQCPFWAHRNRWTGEIIQ
jgi:hypothetical protein